MSSILTNNGAMVALQSLQSINKNLAKTQNLISTGKDVSSAKDNAAVWAISKVMESDVAGFKAIKDSLGLGQSTIAVASNAAETVNDLLTQMKGKIVASQEANVDRAKIQTDIVALRDQIGAVVGAAQFNGLNLLSNTSRTAGTGSVDVLSSLDRSATGVAASDIRVAKEDLGATKGTMATTGGTATASAVTGTATNAQASSTFYTVVAADVAAGTTFQVNAIAGVALTTPLVVGVREGDTMADVQKNLITALNYAADKGGVNGTFSAGTGAGVISFKNDNAAGGTAITTVAADMGKYVGGTDGNVGGGLALISDFDVSTTAGADAALGAIEGMLQISIDAAASFGSASKRIDTQADFIGKMVDTLKSGIGTLVDANMEEASARLQALQVQQQLGVQSLSIANQAPQSILSLFR